MEYTIQKLSKLAGISTRALRYYDEIELLKPTRINSSGYRIYGEKEIDKLQLILFYKELEMPLDAINDIINSPSFDLSKALEDHHEKLLEKREKLNILINNIEHTISSLKGDFKMSNKEKFEGFKKNIINNNEKKYGKEAREKYGDDIVNESNKKFGNMTEDQYEKFTTLGIEINEKLKLAIATNDPASDIAQQVAKMHKDWLGYTWTFYSKEAHAGLAQMYVDDERFTAYYDKIQPGAAVFLRDAILIFTGMNN